MDREKNDVLKALRDIESVAPDSFNAADKQVGLAKAIRFIERYTSNAEVLLKARVVASRSLNPDEYDKFIELTDILIDRNYGGDEEPTTYPQHRKRN